MNLSSPDFDTVKCTQWAGKIASAHQRMSCLRQFIPLLVKAIMVMAMITSRMLLAMTLMISIILFLKKKSFACRGQR